MCRKHHILVLLAALLGILIFGSADASEAGQGSLYEQVKNHPLVKLLGSDYSSIVNKYGQPDWEGDIPDTGCYWYSFGPSREKTMFAFPFPNPKKGNVLAIYYTGKNEISGASVGMTLSEIKDKLGKPSDEYYNARNLMDDTISSCITYAFKGIISVSSPPNSECRNILTIRLSVDDPNQPTKYIEFRTEHTWDGPFVKPGTGTKTESATSSLPDLVPEPEPKPQTASDQPVKQSQVKVIPSKDPGEIRSDKDVGIKLVTAPGYNIVFTLDGKQPRARFDPINGRLMVDEGTRYSEPLVLSPGSTTTIRAIALRKQPISAQSVCVLTGPVCEFRYEVISTNSPKEPAKDQSVRQSRVKVIPSTKPGVFYSDKDVQIGLWAPNHTIVFTIDGEQPEARFFNGKLQIYAGIEYSKPVVISPGSTTTIRAIALRKPTAGALFGFCGPVCDFRYDVKMPTMKNPVKSNVVKQKFSRGHLGIDLASGERGASVEAVFDGEVVDIRTGSYRYDKEEKGSGNFVVILHRPTPLNMFRKKFGEKVYSVYIHLDKVLIQKGNEVKKGQEIGTVGNTGDTTGDTGYHLHLEIRENHRSDREKNCVNPREYIRFNDGQDLW